MLFHIMKEENGGSTHNSLTTEETINWQIGQKKVTITPIFFTLNSIINTQKRSHYLEEGFFVFPEDVIFVLPRDDYQTGFQLLLRVLEQNTPPFSNSRLRPWQWSQRLGDVRQRARWTDRPQSDGF